MADEVNTVLTYGDGVSVDFATLPLAMQIAVARRGFNHIFGNEAASKVTAKFEDDESATDEAKSAYKAQVQQELLKSLLDGSLGSSTRGPRGSAIETLMREIAEKEIRDILKEHKLTMPTGEKKVKFGNAEFTRKELIDRRVVKYADRLKKEAEAAQSKRARMAKATEDLSAELA